MKIFLLLFSLSYFLHAQISPGDLTAYHSSLEGMSNCTKCHEMGKQISNTKCLSCHNEIKTRQSSSKGYHASSDIKNKNCWSCHSEHHGRNFRIVNFNKDKFDHNKTGYQLTGKHAGLQCSDCHKPAFIQDGAVRNRKNTYLGLGTKCISCHTDYHQGTLNTDCSNCHNQDKFTPAAKFNHNNAAFKLTGSHSKVLCIKCHVKEKKNGKDFQRFKGLKFSTCVSCHKDPHQGKFGTDCRNCHSVSSFNDINKSAFNHDKTNFPLIAKHKNVECRSCHNNDLNSKPKHDKCTDCHKDYHKGQFTVNNQITDCKQCHNENGFSPSLYTLEQHNKTKFQLTGAHLAVPCRNCHYQQEEYHFRNLGSKCIDCHKNIHGTELVQKMMPDNDCTSCHQTASWKLITFNHKEKTNFDLTGKHSEVTCNKCHYTNNKFLFASVKANCEYCHKDIHYGQFMNKDSNNTSDCTRCHNFNNWNPSKFDHTKVRFSTEGAHKNVPCISCHKTITKEKISFTNYKLEDFRCASCHR